MRPTLTAIECRCLLDNCTVPMMRAYAMALYIDEEGRRRCKSHESFEDAILAPKFRKSLCLAVTRKVSAGHFANGMRRCLARHLKDDKPGQEALEKLCKTLKNAGPYKKGDNVSLNCSADGSMLISVGDQVVDSVVSTSLCLALFEAYCGSDPVSPSAKRSFVDAWAQLSGVCINNSN